MFKHKTQKNFCSQRCIVYFGRQESVFIPPTKGMVKQGEAESAACRPTSGKKRCFHNRSQAPLVPVSAKGLRKVFSGQGHNDRCRRKPRWREISGELYMFPCRSGLLDELYDVKLFWKSSVPQSWETIREKGIPFQLGEENPFQKMKLIPQDQQGARPEIRPHLKPATDSNPWPLICNLECFCESSGIHHSNAGSSCSDTSFICCNQTAPLSTALWSTCSFFSFRGPTYLPGRTARRLETPAELPSAGTGVVLTATVPQWSGTAAAGSCITRVTVLYGSAVRWKVSCAPTESPMTFVPGTTNAQLRACSSLAFRNNSKLWRQRQYFRNPFWT